jgi:hypothetical protein
MVVPAFGFGVGDFFTIGTLAWNLYNSCKEAPESFRNISSEVLSMHIVLKEVEEVLAPPLAPIKQEHLEAIGKGCYLVLNDLDNLVKRYQSLGSKWTWDRMRYGMEDIAELRARLTSNTGLLTAWIKYVCEFLANLMLMADFLAYLNSVSRRNSASFCKTLGTDVDKARLFPLKQQILSAINLKKSGIIFEEN